MPNYHKFAYDKQVLVEVVPEQDGRRENAYVMFAIVVILAVSGLLLSLTIEKRTKLTALPDELVSIATQLQNAADEIGLLSSMGELSRTPSVSELSQYSLPPFSEMVFEQPNSGCFVTRKNDYQIRLHQEQGAWHVTWRKDKHHNGSGHDKHHSPCTNNPKWQRVTHQINVQ